MTLTDIIHWTHVPIPADVASGTIDLAIGQAGSGHPVGLVMAGVHGDEGPWGAWAIHKFLEQTDAAELAGSLRIVPAANPLAMQADVRYAPPDSIDLYGIFPGNPQGSHSERLAAVLSMQSTALMS